MLASIGKVEDVNVIVAALLHDVVEDTDTTNDEIREHFGGDVASLVAEVTDDKALKKKERKALQVDHAPTLSPGAKLIKIADKISNIRARVHSDPGAEERADLTDYVDWAEKVVAGCRGSNAHLDRMFDDTVKLARSTL